MSKQTMATIAAAVVLAVAVVGISLFKSFGPGSVAAPLGPVLDSGMVLVRGGTYTVGSNEPNSRSVRSVELPAFGIGAREVSVGEYREFVTATGVEAPWGDTLPDLRMPVRKVLHAEAQTYCRWRHANGGKLPSEDEWEAAARGISGRRFPWGAEWRANAANLASGAPVQVGSYPAGRTPDGVEDLIGNVWEWTSTPHESRQGMFVIRGGAYNTPQAMANALMRAPYDPATDRKNLLATGFRCVMPVVTPASR